MTILPNDPPLKDIRVLDFTRVLAGPFCSMNLSDLGAEIIKVEIPYRGDDTRAYPPFINGVSSYYLSLNRGKKSILLSFVKTVNFIYKQYSSFMIHKIITRFINNSA